MILGQLIETGRRFCECRPSDFVPASEDRLVVLSYSVRDMLLGVSLEADSAALSADINNWLNKTGAIAYLLIARHSKTLQEELPPPIGRPPMDTLHVTAATANALTCAAFLLNPHIELGACKLIRTSHAPAPKPYSLVNYLGARVSAFEPINGRQATAFDAPRRPARAQRDFTALLN